MSITDCQLCRKELDRGPVVAYGGGFVHAGCLVAKQFRDKRIAMQGCGDCVSCDQGHPERCGSARRCE